MWNFTTSKGLRIEETLKHTSVNLTLVTHKIIISSRALKRTNKIFKYKLNTKIKNYTIFMGYIIITEHKPNSAKTQLLNAVLNSKNKSVNTLTCILTVQICYFYLKNNNGLKKTS